MICQAIALTDRQPRRLTPSAARVYARLVTGVPVIGFESPERRRTAAIPLRESGIFMSVVRFCSYGRDRAGSLAGGNVARLTGSVCRSLNPSGSAHPCERGLAVKQPLDGDLTMDIHTPGASAPLRAAKPAVFQFHSTEVRTVDRDGQVWFIAGDIAKALGYGETKDMTRVLDEDEADRHIMPVRSEDGTHQTREVTIISESGLYHALLKSRKPEAKPFRRWVTQEVLPAIRRSGGYAVPQDRTPSIVPPGTRLLLTFEADGRYRAEPVPDGAMVVTARQLAEIVEASGYILAKPVDKEFKL